MPRCIAVLAVVLSFASASRAEDLPTPASLEPAVGFWTRVYTEVDSHSGLVHDAEHLGVVYETLRFPEHLSYRAREQRTEQAKSRVRGILHTLAKGKRTGLSSDEARVLAQWPSNVTDTTLRKATANLRFQLGLSDRFHAGLVRSGKWRPFVQQAMAARGVPKDLVALPHVESSYNPKAYSRIGAAGMWQFMRSTGRLYMRVDNVVDERLDPYISSEAAARLLAKNRELTGTWPLAITAYNHGAGGMQRAARTLGTTDMGEIVRRYRSRSFGFASRNFYASFLAASRIDRDPTRYFGAITPESPNSYTEIEVPWFTHASTLARALGVDLGVLQEHNPALRPAVWNGSKHIPREYSLRLPTGTLTRPVTELLAAVPESARLAEQDRDRFHKVGRGETLSRIASRYGVRESELVAVNNLRSRHRISVGQVLVLPDGAAGGRAIASAREPAPADGTYRVRRGDTLSIIAKRFGTTERALAAQNGIRNRHRLSVGQRLRVPGAEPTAVVASTEAPPAGAPAAVPAAAPSPAPVPAEPVPVPTAPATVPSPPVAVAPAPPPGETEPAVAPAETALAEPPAPSPTSPAATPATAPAPAPAPAVPPEPVPAPTPTPTAPNTPDEPPPAAPSDGSSQPDPSDYAVHGNRVTVQAAETLGHYAEWLELRASHLRKLNRMRFEQPVVIGQRLKLDFARISPDEFEQRRLEYHQSLQNEFFEAFTVTGTEQHLLEAGESLWYLAERKYGVPVWLLRQYNPDLDFAALPAGSPLVVPVVEPRAS